MLLGRFVTAADPSSPVRSNPMARIEVRVPALGGSIREALVFRWHKAVGEPVRRDEVIAELETEKATIEVAAPKDGRLAEVRVPQGRSVGAGDLLALLETDASGPIGAPAAPVVGQVPALDCLRCGTAMEAANAARLMMFAGEPVHLLVCRRCGHVELIAENPARF
jgi:pyruvate/2-oxoglutarate dehydrogenase complex dihydrolipoamide acyltransferase (E2) component